MAQQTLSYDSLLNSGVDKPIGNPNPQDLATSDSDATWEVFGWSPFQVGLVLAATGTFLFALKSIFIKMIFAESASPELVLFLRLLFSLPFYVVILWRAKPQPREGEAEVREPGLHWLACLLGFFGYYLASYLDLAGLQYVSAQLERVTLFTYPVMISILAWCFLGEKLSRGMLMALALCFAGVLFMYFDEQDGQTYPQAWLGVSLVALAAASYSAYVLFSKPLMQQMGSVPFTCWAMIGSAFFIAFHFLLVEDLAVFRTTTTKTYLYCFVLACVCTVLPSFMINSAILRIGASRTSVIGTLGPVVTILLAALLLGEPLTVLRLIGVALAVYGVTLVSRGGKEASSSESQERGDTVT